MEYSIGEFSKLTGLVIHTLRYYEQEGLIAPERNSGGRRCYSDKDFTWVEFIKRLKDTGMPIKEIRHYAKLRAAGESTLSARMEMLVQHRQALNEQIAKLQEHKMKLDEKIEIYRSELVRFGADNPMRIRKYQPSDCKKLAELFYHTVHTVNAKDYTKEQLNVWATKQIDLDKWNQSFQKHDTVVAVHGEVIVGFGDIDETGYLDRLYVHKDHQRKGIATAICNQLEQTVEGNIVTHASITARPFFEKRGYKVIKEQQVERRGIFLTNFVMVKEQ